MATETSRDQPTPEEFAGYRLLEKSGSGAAGVVYKALSPDGQETLALKVLGPAEATAPEDAARLERLAAAAPKLRHPHIVPLHDFGKHAGRQYYTMDWVEGMPLDEVIEAGLLSAEQGLEVLEKVARGLDHAHRQAIVHRDLKPANIIVDTDGQPHVTDFGMAKVPMPAGASQSAAVRTSIGIMMGTPCYMAPEQALGRSHEVTARTDVYALGCILYQLLAGELAFDGRSAVEISRKQIQEAPPPLSGRTPEVPAGAAAICMKCLEKKPADRYASAAELADDVRRFLNGEPVHAELPAGAADETAAPKSGKLWLFLLVTLAAGAAAAAGILYALKG